MRSCPRRPILRRLSGGVSLGATLVLAACGGGGAGSSTPAALPGPASAGHAQVAIAGAPTFGVVDANSAWIYAAPLKLAWPKGAPASGDLLIACMDANNNNTPVTPAGWTALYVTGANRKGTALFYKVAGAAEPSSVVFTIPNPYNVGAAMVRVTGAAKTAPLWSHATNAGAATISTAGLVPNVLGMLPLACFSGYDAGAYSAAAGWTLDTSEAMYYPALIEQRQTLSTDTVTAIGVATTDTTPSTSINDAYGLLVAPATAATPTPTAAPTTAPTAAPTAAPTPKPTAAPTATPAPGAVSLAPASVAFSGVAVAAQTVTATQAGNTAFSASSQNCSTVATITALGNGQFRVAPVGVGSCSFTIAGTGGKTASLPVTTTSTVIDAQ